MTRGDALRYMVSQARDLTPEMGVFMLAEIASQLADFNANINDLANSGRPFQVQVEPGQYAIRVESK